MNTWNREEIEIPREEADKIQYFIEALKSCSACSKDLGFEFEDLMSLLSMAYQLDNKDGKKMGNFLKMVFTRYLVRKERAQENENKDIRS